MTRIQDSPIPLAANISLLFTEVPYLERPAAAAAAGFTEIETWWPFATPVPEDADLRRFLDAVGDAAVSLIGLNFWAGDMAAGERGLACRRDRWDELDASIAPLRSIARETGVRHCNLLYGQPLDGTPETEWRAAGSDAIRRHAATLAEFGGVLLIEPLAGGLNGSYPLLTDTDAAAVLEDAGVENSALLFDTFHLGSNGVDLVRAADRPAAPIGHVQLADSPGRGEPGSGSLPIGATISALTQSGYAGRFALEFRPDASTAESLSRLRFA